MKKCLELILKKSGKDWEWLFFKWMFKRFRGLQNKYNDNPLLKESGKHFDKMVCLIFESNEYLLQSLVIDLAKDLWRSSSYNEWYYENKLSEFIIEISDKDKIDWLVKELEG